MIPAKEKAKELVDKFKNLRVPMYEGSVLDTYMGDDMAIQCALIAVDEVIEELIDTSFIRLKYWLEVRQEIEMLKNAVE